jgi:hypothetical protein
MAPVVFLGPLVVVTPFVLWMLSVEHNASNAANTLGFVQGPDYGWDGWYVGRWREHDAAFAATYQFSAGAAPEVARTRRRPTLDVALRVDGPPIGGKLTWDEQHFSGTGTLPGGWAARATRFAQTHGGLTVADGGLGPWPFDDGVVLSHAWPSAVATDAEVEQRLAALREVVYGP